MHTLPTVKRSFSMGENHVANEMSIPNGYARSIDNFVIDNSGMLSSRRMFVASDPRGGHSVFVMPDESCAYFFDGGLMYKLMPTGAVLPVFGASGHFSLQGVDRVWYVYVNDTVYFSNGTSSGKVTPDGVASMWGRDAEVWGVGDQGDDSELRATTLEPFPASRYIASSGGFIYGAVGNVLYRTQPMNYESYDPRYDFTMLSDNIVMVGSVDSGLFVGTTTGVFYIKNGDEKFTRVSNLPPIAGSQVYVPFAQLGVEEINKKTVSDAFCWLTSEGLVAGMDDGRVELVQAGVLKLYEGGNPVSSLVQYDGSYQVLSVLNCALSSAHNRAVDSVTVPL